MSAYHGDYAVDATVQFKWNTNDQTGASITRSTDGTLTLYKGSSLTQRTSLAGVTQTEDFDGATGVHHVTIVLSDNTDAGFYAAGNEYQVVMVGCVIDTKTVNVCIAEFSIERAGGVLALIKAGTVKVDVETIKTRGITCGAAVTILASMGTAATNTAQTGDSYNIVKSGGAGDAAVIKAQTDKLTFGTTGVVDATAVRVGPSGTSTTQTARDIGASVLLSSGTGTGQLDFTSGVVKANLWQYIGTAFGGTAAQIVAAFQKFFDKAAPTGTINSLPDAVPGAAGGGFIAGTNAATSITTALTANITGNITGTLATVTALTNAPVDSTGVTEILTRLPDATAGAAGGLPTVAAGGVKLQQTADLTASQLIFKKNVARANFAFPMFDSTGALKTGLTVTAVIRKDAGASFAALAGSVTEIGVTGWYTVDWAQAETNADTIAFSASAAGANPTCYTILTQA